MIIPILASALLSASPAPAQAVDDGPCPAGTISVASAGADYTGGQWLLADGTVFGTSAEEDECITPVHSDAWVERYPGSDGIEVEAFDARCTGVLVWSYDPGEFVCISAYVPSLPETR